MGYKVNNEKGISDFFYCRKISGPRFHPHIHSHIEFVYVLSGEIIITIGNDTFEIKENHTAVILPYEIHSYMSSPETEAFVLACPPEYIAEYRKKINGSKFEPPYFDMSGSQKTLISEITKNSDQQNMLKKALIYCTLAQLFEKCIINERNVFEYDLYRKAIVYICEHYAEGICMEDVARSMGVTSSHLSRVLNSNGKSGYTDIVNSLRVHAAKELLENENIPVSEIALNVGFGSIRNFNRIFKEHFGVTPKDARKN